jgi:hypothetical protein
MSGLPRKSWCIVTFRRACELMDFLYPLDRDYCIGRGCSRVCQNEAGVCGAGGQYPSLECRHRQNCGEVAIHGWHARALTLICHLGEGLSLIRIQIYYATRARPPDVWAGNLQSGEQVVG